MSSPQSKMAFQPLKCAPGNRVRRTAGGSLADVAAGLLLGLVLFGPALPALAVPVADLYVAQVPTDGLGAAELDAAYARALDQVLVRVTGRGNLAMDPAQRSAIGSAGALVRRYQPMPDGQLRVSFDPEAVRRRLDAAHLPVWAGDRPRTLIVLPPADATAGAPPLPSTGSVGNQGTDPEQQLLLDMAARRGVPVVISRGPVPAVPAAGTDVLLVGRPLPEGGAGILGWTLVQGDGDRTEWQGDLAAGVNGLADRLAARYAGTAMTGPPLRLRIQGVDSFDAYGRVQGCLGRLGVIQHLALTRLTGDTLVYDVVVRGDARQLVDALALQGVLEPVPAGPGADSAAGTGSGDLDYRLVAVR